MSKEQILEGYLNTIYFGHGAYGIQAASKAYFDVDAKKLTVPQAAVLATVVNNPSLYDPSDEDNIPRLIERYRYVLHSMAEMGDITPRAGGDVRDEAAEVPRGHRPTSATAAPRASCSRWSSGSSVRPGSTRPRSAAAA